MPKHQWLIKKQQGDIKMKEQNQFMFQIFDLDPIYTHYIGLAIIKHWNNGI